MTLQITTFAYPEELRGHLDALNESGISQISTAGVDKIGEAFVIMLSGPYAEEEVVVFGNPWDDNCTCHRPRCDECQGVSHEMECLSFPVTVIRNVE